MAHYFKIMRLKGTIKKYYNIYFDELDNYSCGRTLAEHFSLKMSDAKKKVNNALDELTKIDPACPMDRL